MTFQKTTDIPSAARHRLLKRRVGRRAFYEEQSRRYRMVRAEFRGPAGRAERWSAVLPIAEQRCVMEDLEIGLSAAVDRGDARRRHHIANLEPKRHTRSELHAESGAQSSLEMHSGVSKIPGRAHISGPQQLRA
ncbi:MAG: hypothetical protein JNM17_29295 [Archangium sp.]|nr:hypothetical protein [Archangium sp.]